MKKTNNKMKTNNEISIKLMDDSIRYGVELPKVVADAFARNYHRAIVSPPHCKKDLSKLSEIVSMTYSEILKLRSLGSNKADLLVGSLKKAGLSLGMDILNKEEASILIMDLKNEIVIIQGQIDDPDVKFILSRENRKG